MIEDNDPNADMLSKIVARHGDALRAAACQVMPFVGIEADTIESLRAEVMRLTNELAAEQKRHASTKAWANAEVAALHKALTHRASEDP
jgi:low affinity Fe/Cu permease